MKTKLNFLKLIAKGALGALFAASVIFALTSELVAPLERYVDQNFMIFLFLSGAVLLATQIAAPLSGLPVYITISRFAGLEVGFLLLGTTYIVSGVTNFYIARLFGRPIVSKIVGNVFMSRIEDIGGRLGFWSVFASRTVGYYYHDIFSYIWGLTPVPTKTYLLSTIFGTILAVGTQYVIFQNIDVSDRSHLLIFYVGMVVMAVLSLVVWRLFLAKKN